MELINKTTVFEENQVLTAGQLNTTQQFLFQESRLTRIRLIGRGIVCGLHATYGVNTVHISKGLGVTSWGFLISLGDCDLTHYKPYTLPDGLDYTYFNNAPLLELVTAQNAAPTGATPITAALILSDYVVVLFLESATRDLKSCLGKSCDDLGKENTFTVRKLLIKQTDLININASNKNKGGAMYPALYELETIEYPRALITRFAAANYPVLINTYLSPVAAILEKLTKQLSIIYTELPALVRHFPGVDFDGIRTKWEEKLMELSAQYLSGKAYGFQYVYDAFEDIIKSYEELRCIAMHLHSVCLPDEDAFPMHLMLGSKACPPSVFRQEFEYSPLFNEYKDWSKKLVSVFGRTLAMLNGYYDNLTEKDDRGILITPSKEKWQNIGKRAFPIYFDPNLSDFEKYWNESLCHGCDNGKPLSYHYQLPVKLQSYGMSRLEAPLLYNLSDTSFFRMEGHLAMTEDVAVSQYKKLQRRFNLPFKVRSIFMGEGGTMKTVCRYPDLDSQYLVWRNIMLYYLNNLIKYSTLAEKMIGRFDDVKDAAKDAVSGVDTKKEAIFNKDAAGMETFNDASVNTEKKSAFSNINSVFIKAGMVNERINQANYARINNSKGRMETTPDDLQREALHLVARFNDNIEELIATLTLEFSDFDEKRFKSVYNGLIETYVSGMKLMAKIINQDGNVELMAYLMAATILHRGLNVLMIRPYITIGTLTDIRSQRNKSLSINISFYDYIRNAGAVEHLAGVNKGNTLLLLYHTGKEIEYRTDQYLAELKEEKIMPGANKQKGKYLSEFEVKFNERYDKLAEEIGKQGLENIASNVIADFTVYEDDSCCECDAKDYQNKELTPLVVPISRFVVYNQSKINTAKIQVLNNLYHPGEYKVIVKSDPNFGSVTFEEEIYEPKPSLKKQILVYTLDPQRQVKNKRLRSSVVAIDELEYAIVENETGKEVGSATITFFIGIGRIGEDTFELNGTVAYGQQYKITVLDPNGTMVQENEFTGTYYSFSLIPGKYHIVLDGIRPQGRVEKDTEIIDKDVTLDFSLGKK